MCETHFVFVCWCCFIILPWVRNSAFFCALMKQLQMKKSGKNIHGFQYCFVKRRPLIGIFHKSVTIANSDHLFFSKAGFLVNLCREKRELRGLFTRMQLRRSRYVKRYSIDTLLDRIVSTLAIWVFPRNPPIHLPNLPILFVRKKMKIVQCWFVTFNRSPDWDPLVSVTFN